MNKPSTTCYDFETDCDYVKVGANRSHQTQNCACGLGFALKKREVNKNRRPKQDGGLRNE
jgi:hypothetical protein